MTIDEAIKVADANAELYSSFEGWGQAVSFYDTCGDALRMVNAMRSETQSAEELISDAPDAWQERRKREYRETKDRYERLHWMVTKYEAGVLEYTPKCSIELLKQQKKHMGEYLHDLEVSAFVEGVEL